MPKLTQKRLKELLHYDPTTGIFVCKINRGKNKIGMIAGGYNAGYIIICIDYIKYKAHRLAWLYTYGYFPENEIDHIDRIKDNNRLYNLREVSRLCNSRNCNKTPRNKSGIIGVSYYKRYKKWRAGIKDSHKSIHLGCFYKIEDAARARWGAEKKYNFPNCNTTSSAYQYLQSLK